MPLPDPAALPLPHPARRRGGFPLQIAKFSRLSLSPWIVLLFAASAAAAPPSDTVLPSATKGYISVAHPTEFKERWNKTQFGQMLNDESMQPFIEDLREQLQDKYRAFEDKLGIEWEELEGVPAGEMSLALIERKGENAALAITIDVTGHDKQADGLLAAIEKRFKARGGKKQSAKSGGVTLQVFTVPADAGSPPQVTVYFIKDNLLCGVDDRKLAEGILRRFTGDAKDNLKSVAAYGEVLERCTREAKGLEPEARWFVEPFGCIFAARTLREENERSRFEQDFAKLAYENGFDAIKGAGGFVNQLVDGHLEIVHRSAVYAPVINEGDKLRWTKSMRMLQLPNVDRFEPQSWVPRMIASYTTFNMQINDAFDNVGPIFDAVQDHEDAWANTLDGWKNDPYGAKVDVREEIIAHLGQRITLLRGYNMPIGPESERSLFAIEATNEKALSDGLKKWMSREPDIVRRELGPYVVWERVTPDHAVEEPQVEVPGGFTPLRPDDEDDAQANLEERESVLPNSAVTVALGHLMMGSDIEYLGEILQGFGQTERLASTLDYQQVGEVVNRLAPGPHSGYSFGRSDEEFRPTYELIRQGKMPEAKTMLGKFLNNMLTSDEERKEGVLRRQRIDGSTLPNFESVRRYLGSHGGVLRSDKDGWFITGAVLNKEAP